MTELRPLPLNPPPPGHSPTPARAVNAKSNFLSVMESLDALGDALKLRIVVNGPADVLPAGKPGRKRKTPKKTGR